MKREMNKQDKLYQNIKNAAQKQEQQPFKNKEKVWDVVSKKLNPKKRKRMILYRTLSAAAVILVIVIAGWQYNSNQNTSNTIDVVNEEQPIIDKSIIIADSQKVVVEEIKEELKGAEKLNSTSVDSLDEIEKDAQSTVSKQSEPKDAFTYSSSLVADATEEHKTPEPKQETQIAVLDEVEEVSHTGPVDIEKTLNNTASYGNVSNENQKVNTIANVRQNDFLIKGVVLDENTFPLPSVFVQVKGTNNGTTTDFDGKYSISASPDQILVFKYTGYKTKEVKVGSQSIVNVSLELDVAALNEVVVTTHQGILKESQVVSSSVVQAEADEQISRGHADKVLQGRVAGVQINSNRVSDQTDIRIRGVASIHSGNPLFIVDGKPVKRKDFQKLDSNAISGIKVLKDKNATKLYGNRAKDGVVVILTKGAGSAQKQAFDRISNTSSYPIPNNEEYETYKENPFTSPLSEPLSTFSVDVDRAAYTNIRRLINNGQEVPKDAVRIEEMLNFFEYDYDKPSGKDPFAIHTEYSDAPWNENHKLLKIALQGKDVPKEQLPASNLVFLIDVSGSMNSQNKLPLVKKSLNLLVDQMRAKDKIALVTYAGNSEVILEPTRGDAKTKIKQAINQLSSGGGTYASEGIETAYSLAEEHFVKNGNNRVIIATDGDFNIGVTANNSLEDLISEKRNTNIFLTCLGYGMGNFKDSKMQSLSQQGNGNYAYIDTYQEAQKFLEREFKGSLYAIAKDVKIQIEFNPRHVQSYRLIGYETRMLEDRDFDDDTKDAGEIGVNHQVTALYEVVPMGVKSPFGEFNPDLKYQKVTKPNFNLFSDELATVKFRYKPPKEDQSIKMERVIKNNSVQLKNASSDFKFATAVAWFGLKLRKSDLITEKNKEAIISLAKEGLENDSDGYRAEFIRLVRLSE
jgi:Ca-activated chloride channel family protein